MRRRLIVLLTVLAPLLAGLPGEARSADQAHTTDAASAPMLAQRDRFTGLGGTTVLPRKAPYKLRRTFALHSRPGALLTIYLDLDGYTLSDSSYWVDAGLPAQKYPGWSMDSNTSSFSRRELIGVQTIWRRVSEDFAPFDVDVTTEAPDPEAIQRDDENDDRYGAIVAVTSSKKAQAAAITCAGRERCSGTSYLDVFGLARRHMDAQPSWVFTRYFNDVRAISETASHELGHQFGLHHDGVAAGSGRSAAEYYRGQGIWSPIMGESFHPLTQWSRGEYAGADNTEDDLAIIAKTAPLVTDDVGNSILTASSVLPTTSSPGLISTRHDVDMYALGHCAGTWKVKARPTAASPDLDLKVRVLDPLGALLGTANPKSRQRGLVVEGLGAVVKVAHSLGLVYVTVAGTGSGRADTTGYSSYASLGQYAVTATCQK